ncbi:MAG: VOC family protein [Hyphomicrobiales bacterium]|nr:VOC family protein [Hyphomicrobiales bacterium]MCP5374205.1 VOC family protein [Hyphomicrobiales bacterium]
MSPPVIDHVGIIVADLDAAVAMMRPLFGGDPAYVKEMPEVGLRVAAFEAANVTVELLQYTDDGSDFAKQVMGERLGLNHLSARVEDVATAVTELTAAGFTPQAGFPRPGAHGQVAFFDPDPVTGLLFEVCAPDPKDGP